MPWAATRGVELVPVMYPGRCVHVRDSYLARAEAGWAATQRSDALRTLAAGAGAARRRDCIMVRCDERDSMLSAAGTAGR